jgi:hypothetical protein
MNPNKKDISVEIALYESLYEDNYIGCYHSLGNCVKDLFVKSSDISESLMEYIDWEKMGQDWKLRGDLISIEIDNQQHHVFLSSRD